MNGLHRLCGHSTRSITNYYCYLSYAFAFGHILEVICKVMVAWQITSFVLEKMVER